MAVARGRGRREGGAGWPSLTPLFFRPHIPLSRPSCTMKTPRRSPSASGPQGSTGSHRALVIAPMLVRLRAKGRFGHGVSPVGAVPIARWGAVILGVLGALRDKSREGVESMTRGFLTIASFAVPCKVQTMTPQIVSSGFVPPSRQPQRNLPQRRASAARAHERTRHPTREGGGGARLRCVRSVDQVAKRPLRPLE